MDSRCPIRSLLAMLLILPIASVVNAGPVTFIGSMMDPESGSPNGLLSASVKFEYGGSPGLLKITLTNTSNSNVMNPSGLLNAVFFDMTGNPTTLTRISAQLNAGSSVFFGNDGGGNIGGEWGYKAVASGGLGGEDAPHVTQNQGIGSSGYGIFGPPYSFPGSDLDGTGDGSPAYGLTSAGDDLAVGNAAVTGQFALIKNSAVFTLSGLNGVDDNTDLSTIFSNVRFQYGTSLNQPSFGGNPDGGPNPVPVPAGVLLMGLGGICLAGYNIRRNRKVAKLA